MMSSGKGRLVFALLVLFLGSFAFAEAAGTGSSMRLRRMLSGVSAEKATERGSGFGGFVQKVEGFVSGEVKLIEQGGGGGEDADGFEQDADATDSGSAAQVDFKLRTGPTQANAASMTPDPLALGASVSDEFGGSFRDEELPQPTPSPPLKSHAPPVYVGEYAPDLQEVAARHSARSPADFGAASLQKARQGIHGLGKNGTTVKASFAEKKKVVEEYDLEVPKPSKEEMELEKAAEEHENDGTVLDGEKLTKEDVSRLKTKDGVTPLKDLTKRFGASPRVLRRLGLRSQRRLVLKSRLKKNSNGAHRTMKVGRRQGRLSAKNKISHAQLGSTLDDMAPGAAKMKTQCMSFGSFLAGQDIQGTELLRVVKSTCQPAVMDGSATPAYSTMCSALGGAVEKFVVSPTWSPDELCEAMIKVFNEAKIGDIAR